jgi:hypothetical protein
MFAASCFNQLVHRVVREGLTRFGSLILEEDGLLRIVHNVRDISTRVRGVLQALNLTTGPACDRWLRTVSRESGGAPGNEQISQLKCQKVVSVYALDRIVCRARSRCPLAL